MHLTSGERDNSHVFHFKEDNKYFQYHINNVNKKSLNLICMYRKLKKCPAKVSLVPKNPNTIKTIRTEKGVLKYALNEEIPLNKKSGQDWSIKVDSGKGDHSSYCTVQVPLAKRPRMEDIDEDSSTSVQIRNHNRKFSRFGPGQTLARAFRHEQTRTAIIQKTCQIRHVENAWNMTQSGGARLLEKISDSKMRKNQEIIIFQNCIKQLRVKLIPLF